MKHIGPVWRPFQHYPPTKEVRKAEQNKQQPMPAFQVNGGHRQDSRPQLSRVRGSCTLCPSECSGISRRRATATAELQG